YLDFPCGDKEIAGFLTAGSVLTSRADDNPSRMAAAAGECVPSVHTPATRYGHANRARNNGACGKGLGVIAPDVDLPTLRQAGDDPFEFAQHAVNPRAGGTPLGEDLNGFEEHAERSLVAAEASRLQQSEDARTVEI